MTPSLLVVVPTLGESPLLVPCLEALRQDLPAAACLVVVVQGAAPAATLDRVAGLADRVLALPERVGFAAANDLGWASEQSELVATVNDDLLVEPGWCQALLAALAAHPEAAAVQGVNLDLADLRRVDGCGIGWNRAWQAVQLERRGSPPAAEEPPREIFGASATAVIYRRSALAVVALPGVALPGGAFFDRDLFTYYEDVDLACRLRAAGFPALLVPGARARHAGSLTGARQPVRMLSLIYGNRLLVLARFLGRAFAGALPRALGRDLADLGAAALRGRVGTVLGIARGWARAARRLPRYLHTGPPGLPPAALERFRVRGGGSSR